MFKSPIIDNLLYFFLCKEMLIMKTENGKIMYLLILLYFSIVITGCGSSFSSPPAYPTTDRCLGLHTQGLPECRPPASTSSSPHPSLPDSTGPGFIWIAITIIGILFALYLFLKLPGLWKNID